MATCRKAGDRPSHRQRASSTPVDDLDEAHDRLVLVANAWTHLAHAPVSKPLRSTQGKSVGEWIATMGERRV
jgi:hypothetical protein